ncbi:MAG: hypothetical protein RSC01_07625 [Oscillospiraceae bacterium]
MSFCYYAEKSAWKRAHNELDAQLNLLGMSENQIAQLREYDWECFNQERKFYRYLSDTPELIFETAVCTSTNLSEIDVDDFLSRIENTHLHAFLIQVNKKTLQALLLRYAGFSGKDIEHIIGIPEHAINSRITRLIKKLKKHFSDAT